MTYPFDAVLLVSFGGPQGLDDIRPFLSNVLRGRRIPPERVEAVAHHYERFGGVSPLTALTFEQANGLAARLEARGAPLPVYTGMRNWRPFLADTLRDMVADGVRRAIGFIMAAHRSYSSCEQYKQNVRQAAEELRRDGIVPPTITYVGDWHTHPGFIEANALRVSDAIAKLSDAHRSTARIVFTAHSVPTAVASQYPYVRQLDDSARLVAQRLGRSDWALVYQSRSGRPGEPWLEPDVNDYLRAEAARGLRAAVLAPIGFVCDHIEVLYDLDVEAAATAASLRLELVRAESVNAHPRFLDMMADVVFQTMDRYRAGLALPMVNAARPNATELPPVVVR